MEWSIKRLAGVTGFRFAVMEESSAVDSRAIAIAPTERDALRLIEALQIRQDVFADVARVVQRALAERELARRN